MNEREKLLLLLEQASTALVETQKKLDKAEEVVADWDEATLRYKNKTLEEWKQKVAELKEKEKDAKQEVKEARASFDRVVQGILF